MVSNYFAEYKRWSESPALDSTSREELFAISTDDSEIKSRFFAPLDFGTAGLRGIMGPGIARMNPFVIRQATQAFANLIDAEGPSAKNQGIIIAHDCRNNSRLFALEAAKVMIANGIRVRLFDDLRPTPELSFAIRDFSAIAGINITASHNPPQYNGYKVYWDDGAQLPPEHAARIADAISRIDVLAPYPDVDLDSSDLFELIGEVTDNRFLDHAIAQSVNPSVIANSPINVVFTPFHGTGYKLIPDALRRLGLANLFCVPEQMTIDGNFPTVKSPNPEDPDGFNLAIQYALRHNADIIIGTDPDADRISVLCRHRDSYRQLSGNQLGALLLDYIINAKRQRGSLPPKPAALKTIVSTELARRICDANNVFMEDTFTGFKFMAEKIKDYERSGSYNTIFAFEESIGYLIGDFVRDKDAVTTSILVAEMAASYLIHNKSLLDALNDLYSKFGFFAEKTLNLVMPGIDGLDKMNRLMLRLRQHPPLSIGNRSVLRIRDYLSGSLISSSDNSSSPLNMKGSNVLYFELDDNSAFIIRPSGTEPKIKIYIMVSGSSHDDCNNKIELCSISANDIANSI